MEELALDSFTCEELRCVIRPRESVGIFSDFLLQYSLSSKEELRECPLKMSVAVGTMESQGFGLIFGSKHNPFLSGRDTEV